MRRIFLAVVLAVPLSAFAPGAWATADGPDFYRVQGISAGSLLLRAAPGPTGARIGAIPKGAVGLKNLGCMGGMRAAQFQQATPEARKRARYMRWCKIEYKGAIGWVAGWFLAESEPPPMPSFDCANAHSDAEKLICTDTDLARLDRELDRLYGLAETGEKAGLKAYQRGWIKGRDDCWKAGDGIKECMVGEYARRIHELRIGLAASGKNDTAGTSIGPFVYHCDGMEETVSAVFIRGKLSLASLRLAPGWLTLPQLISASGARYGDAGTDGSKLSFWIKGADALFQRGRRAATVCRTEATN